jgi:hypothetical protein
VGEPAEQTLGGVTALACDVGIATRPTAKSAANDNAPRWRAERARRAGQAMALRPIAAALSNSATGRSMRNSAIIDTGSAGTAPWCAA